MDFNLEDDIDFSIPEKNKKVQKVTERERCYLKKIKYSNIVLNKATSFKDIVGLTLEKNTQYRFITNKSFNAVTVLQHIINSNKIIELYIVVYRMNNLSFDLIKNIIETDNIKSGFIISIFFRNNKKYERWVEDLKQMNIDNKKCALAFVNSHAKIFMAKTNTGNHFVFEGSGNLSHNERIEQYIYEDNKEVYEFHKNWIERELSVK